jgi:hypothetical protein
MIEVTISASGTDERFSGSDVRGVSVTSAALLRGLNGRKRHLSLLEPREAWCKCPVHSDVLANLKALLCGADVDVDGTVEVT